MGQLVIFCRIDHLPLELVPPRGIDFRGSGHPEQGIDLPGSDRPELGIDLVSDRP